MVVLHQNMFKLHQTNVYTVDKQVLLSNFGPHKND